MAHLHLHSQYSVIDGRGQIDEYIDLIKQDSQEALALTDHGTLGGVIEGYMAAKKAGLKFIPGCEIYVDAYELREKSYPGHLTVLAKNEEGYRALIAANNLAHRQFYYRPRLTLGQIIDNNFAENWVVLSGCMSSPIFHLPYSDAENIVTQLAKHSGNFFIEAMAHDSFDEAFQAKQDMYLERISALHKATGLPFLLTNDCHFAHKHQEDFHSALMKMSTQPSELEFDGDEFYFKTSRQMDNMAQRLGVNNAWDNAVEVAKLCDVHIPEADVINWHVPDLTNGKALETVREICEQALNHKELSNEYWERCQYELDVLKTSAAILNSYLVAHDVIVWCADRNIPIAARGSMAGSLVSYLMGITLEDPVKYNLSFNRAVNPARPTIPDFDLDVSSYHRSEVLEYLKERYQGNVPICAYTHYGPKGALRKILAMEGYRNPQSINELSKQLPDDWPPDKMIYEPEWNAYVYPEGTPDDGHVLHYVSPRDHETIRYKPKWLEPVPENYHNFVSTYQGLFKSMSVHPSGVLISGPERELEHEVPMQWIASSKMLVSAFDMYTLKKMGLFKLDVLGLSALDALAFMERVSQAKLPNDDYDEPEVLAAFSADLLAEIFQMHGYAARQVIKDISKPQGNFKGGIVSFEDLIAANTLARPGAAQFTDFYRTGFPDLLEEYPQLHDTLGYTNGLILYQEQVMEMCRILADFDDAEQDAVKEAIKYFQHETFRGLEELFIKRCNAKGIRPEKAIKGIVDMSKYSYNRAHAMTYAAIAYKMMWYKVHFPAVYYAAVFDDADDKERLILESHFFRVKWHPADVNDSNYETVVREGEIYLGLSCLKGIGPGVYGAIARSRPYLSMDDFMEKVERRKCNVRHIAILRDSMACLSLKVPGTPVAFEEAFGFNYRFMNSELSFTLAQWSNEGDNRIGGFITDARTMTVQKAGPNYGKEMCRVDVTNINGRKRCILFPDTWKKMRGFVYSGAAVKFYGQFQMQGDFIVGDGEEYVAS